MRIFSFLKKKNLPYQRIQLFIQSAQFRVVRIQGDNLLKIILGFAVIIFCIVNFVQAEQRIAVPRVRDKA